jgi:Acyl-CoA synthetases (AMP-forming)/AMP-acid ligases II
MTTLDFLDRGVSLYGDAVGIIADDGTTYTYAEFGERVDRAAVALADCGIGAGDRVGILAPNTHYFLEVLFATNLLGAVTVPMNYRLIADDYAYILGDCGASMVVADTTLTDPIDAVREVVPAGTFIAAGPGPTPADWQPYEELLAAADPAAVERADVAETDVATINYTSGTTSDPKGVVRTHRTEHYHALITAHHTEITDADVYLWTLPMFHVNGWGYPYVLTGVGATHVCQRSFDAADAFDRIHAHDVSYLCGAPTVLDRLIDHHRRTDVAPTGANPVRIATAASPPPPATIRTVEDELGWRILHVYGLTETGPLITTSNAPRRIAEAGRFTIKTRQGHAMLGTELRVVDADGQEVPPDDATMGEILVRGNQVMDRYWQKPDETDAAFSGRLDGWFHTGDIATIDRHGMIAIKDREKDVIISGGENISSVEVEDALYEHPAIERVAVVGVPHPEWGETPAAFVIREADAALTEAGVIAFAREQLAHFKCPTSVTFVESLPETATGKIRKVALRERVEPSEG